MENLWMEQSSDSIKELLDLQETEAYLEPTKLRFVDLIESGVNQEGQRNDLYFKLPAGFTPPIPFDFADMAELFFPELIKLGDSSPLLIWDNSYPTDFEGLKSTPFANFTFTGAPIVSTFSRGQSNPKFYFLKHAMQRVASDAVEQSCQTTEWDIYAEKFSDMEYPKLNRYEELPQCLSVLDNVYTRN